MNLKNMNTEEQKSQNNIKNNTEKNKILESALQQMPRVKMMADLKTMLSEIREEDLPFVYCLIQEELSNKSSNTTLCKTLE